jgi:hypothetical protein
MAAFFVTVSLSFRENARPEPRAFAQELKALGLGHQLISTGGHPMELPKNVFAGPVKGRDKKAVHLRIHDQLAAILKRGSLHGRLLISVSRDPGLSCSFF